MMEHFGESGRKGEKLCMDGWLVGAWGGRMWRKIAIPWGRRAIIPEIIRPQPTGGWRVELYPRKDWTTLPTFCGSVTSLTH